MGADYLLFYDTRHIQQNNYSFNSFLINLDAPWAETDLNGRKEAKVNSSLPVTYSRVTQAELI